MHIFKYITPYIPMFIQYCIASVVVALVIVIASSSNSNSNSFRNISITRNKKDIIFITKKCVLKVTTKQTKNCSYYYLLLVLVLLLLTSAKC